MDNITIGTLIPVPHYVLCPEFFEDFKVCKSMCYFENGNFTNCSLSPDEDYDQEYKEALSVESVTKIVVPTLFAIFFLLGIAGNALVLKVLVSHKHMQNTTNILLGSLALTDLLFIVLCVPYTAIEFAMTQWMFGRIWCKVSQYFISVTACASIWTLVLISVSRYRAILHPIANLKMRSRRNTYLVLCALWLIVLVGNIPTLFMFDEFNYIYIIEVRSTCLTVNIFHNKIFYTCFFVFGFVLPLAIICPLYGMILRKLIYSVGPGDYKNSKVIQSKLKVSRMICIVVIVFAICWLPIDLILLIQSFTSFEPTKATTAILITANCMAYINSCINPILYGFLSKNFRKSYRNLLCCFARRSSKVRFEMRNFRSLTMHDRFNSTASTRLDRNVTPDRLNSCDIKRQERMGILS
ncbi:hypothetical protein FSP39_020382 [Pinctada imbricata]|uniref:G-protein coupled receptors family 1 profile domain-containing protein n=1 Tax=Pinctada imbricata TaxID=66713 RepID=A0AA89BXS8_PINIB|nr:hypothetical protein FSP39_020382 [Pinctada imbricata]